MTTPTVAELASDERFIRFCLTDGRSEREFWRSRSRRDPHFAARMAEAREVVWELYRVGSTPAPPGFAAAIWERIEREVPQAADPLSGGLPNRLASPAALRRRTVGGRHPRRGARPPRRVAIPGLAAVLAIALVGLYYALPSIERGLSGAVTDDRPDRGAHWTEVANPGDTALTLPLPDGSTVRLAPESRLRYPQRFGRGGRPVHLTGEAFFDVARDSTSPFAVLAEGTVTRVLGTSFNVQAYPDGDEVEVDVYSGEVAVSVRDPGAEGNATAGRRPADGRSRTSTRGASGAESPPVRLLPNQRVTFDRKRGELALDISRAPRLLSSGTRVHGRRFVDASFGEVARALATAYGVTIDLDDPTLARCDVTVTLAHGSLFGELEVLCAILELTYARRSGRIILSGPGCRE